MPSQKVEISKKKYRDILACYPMHSVQVVLNFESTPYVAQTRQH